jgi:hypothetical protein
MSILLNQNNANEVFDNSSIQMKNKDNNSRDSNKNNDKDIKENLMKYTSTGKNWNLEGTIWYLGKPCPPDSKSSVPPCNGPYPNYPLTIKSLDGKNITTLKTDLDGKFRIFLEPSSYIITAQNMPDFKVTLGQSNITQLHEGLFVSTGLE